MNNDVKQSWFKLSFVEQMVNIGNEVKRTFRLDDIDKRNNLISKTIEYTELSIQDSKNKDKVSELKESKNLLEHFDCYSKEEILSYYQHYYDVYICDDSNGPFKPWTEEELLESLAIARAQAESGDYISGEDSEKLLRKKYFNKPEVTRHGAINAFHSLRAQAKENGVSGMSEDEINYEIAQARTKKTLNKQSDQ